MSHLNQGLGQHLSRRAFGHDEDPDRFDRTVAGFGLSAHTSRQGADQGGLNRVKGVGLAAAAPGLAVGPVNFDYFNPASTEKTGQVGSIGSGSFNPDLATAPKLFEPPEQFFVAGRRWGEGLRAQQGSQGVECRGYMNIQVGVDPTRHPTRAASTMVMAIPSFPQSVQGWHGRSGLE